MSRHLILGAGLIGAHLNTALLNSGGETAVATRSGTLLPGARTFTLDAADAAALTAAARSMDTIFVCTNPPLHRWSEQWPPVIGAVLEAARTTGAQIVLMGNLYAYGVPAGPMTESGPLAATETKGRVRRCLWETLLAAHHRGEVRATEVRAGDYFGPGAAATAHLGSRFFAPLKRGGTAWVVGRPDVRHDWAYLPDIARVLAAAAGTPEAFGRAWIVPPASSASRQELTGRVNRMTGRNGRVAAIPRWALDALGCVSPIMREVRASDYQFRQDFTTDSSRSRSVLGVDATDLDTALDRTLAALP